MITKHKEGTMAKTKAGRPSEGRKGYEKAVLTSDQRGGFTTAQKRRYGKALLKSRVTLPSVGVRA